MRWLQGMFAFVFREYARGRVFAGIRRRGLRAYFRAINGVRRLLVCLVLLSLLLQVMVTSFLALIAVLTFGLIHDDTTRVIVLGGVFGLLFLIPLVGGSYLLSEAFWLKLSGAGRLIEPAGE